MFRFALSVVRDPTLRLLRPIVKFVGYGGICLTIFLVFIPFTLTGLLLALACRRWHSEWIPVIGTIFIVVASRAFFHIGLYINPNLFELNSHIITAVIEMAIGYIPLASAFAITRAFLDGSSSKSSPEALSKSSEGDNNECSNQTSFATEEALMTREQQTPKMDTVSTNTNNPPGQEPDDLDEQCPEVPLGLTHDEHNLLEIFIAKRGQQTGPFTIQQIQTMVSSGMVELTDMAWHSTLLDWAPLHQVLQVCPPPPRMDAVAETSTISQPHSKKSHRPTSINRIKTIISIVLTAIACAIGGIVARSVVKVMPSHSDATFTDKLLIDVSKKLNTTLPLQLDKGTRLDSTFPGPGNRLTYFYTLLDFPGDDRLPSEIIEAIRPQLINAYRTNPDMALLRQKQVEMCCQYRDRNGKSLAEFSVSAKDLR